jgi:hypothetical protein
MLRLLLPSGTFAVVVVGGGAVGGAAGGGGEDDDEAGDSPSPSWGDGIAAAAVVAFATSVESSTSGRGDIELFWCIYDIVPEAPSPPPKNVGRGIYVYVDRLKFFSLFLLIAQFNNNKTRPHLFCPSCFRSSTIFSLD